MSKKTIHPNTPNVVTEQDKGRCAPAPGSAWLLCYSYPNDGDHGPQNTITTKHPADWLAIERARAHYGSPPVLNWAMPISTDQYADLLKAGWLR
jgi:hypothetical protein